MSPCPLLSPGPPTAAGQWKDWRGGRGCRWMPRFHPGASREALGQEKGASMASWPRGRVPLRCRSSDPGEQPGQVSLASGLPSAWLVGVV